jgi:hypothetical protein
MDTQHDHARMSAGNYRRKDAELVREEADAELDEWEKILHPSSSGSGSPPAQ